MGIRLYLVDASPYIFRAFHALPETVLGADGTPANAVHGFAAFLIRLIGEERPTHLAVAFDGSLTDSFRNELFPDYKARREPPPAELVAQQAPCREVADALGAAVFVDDRFEADDLIATLMTRLPADPDARAVVVSSDKDLAQLVGPERELYDFARGDRYGPAEVEERFGVPPERIVDLLALGGDPVDNIPGVAGIGHKTAAALIRELGGVEALYRRPEAVAATGIRGARALQQRLEAQRDIAMLSLELAQVSERAPVAADLAALRYLGPRLDAWRGLCVRFGCERLRERGEALQPALALG